MLEKWILNYIHYHVLDIDNSKRMNIWKEDTILIRQATNIAICHGTYLQKKKNYYYYYYIKKLSKVEQVQANKSAGWKSPKDKLADE